MDNKASLTALMSAYGRAFHNERAKLPVFCDYIAKKLMTDEEYSFLGKFIVGGLDFFAPEKKGDFATEEQALEYLVNTQIAPTPIARAAFCEQSLKTAAATGAKQFVILGAGLDTFALREREFVQKHKFFEVDHPLTQADKMRRIERAGLSLPDNVKFVPVDFSVDDLGEKLTQSGFDPRLKTFYSWLGVSYYLTEEQIEKFLGELAEISTDGSSLVFDYADGNLFCSKIKRVRNMLAMAQAGGEPMKSCFSCASIETLLGRHGFLVYELLTCDDIQEMYFEGREDFLSAFEHICYAHAVIKK